MINTKRRNFLFIFIAAALLSVALSFGVANAAPSPSSNKNGANGMRISPLRTDLTIKPGESKAVSISVKNLTNANLDLTPIENDFVAGGEDGHPALILNQDSYAPMHSLKRFMIPIQSFTLAPNQIKTVKVMINVPPSAQAGGYFGALRFAPTKTVNKQLSLNSSVASLILMTVPGPTKHALVLTDFDVQQHGNSSSYFSSPKNTSLLMRFQNNGNVQEGPFGQINVTKGGKPVYSYNFNQGEPKQVVLPDTARRWSLPLKHLGKFGKYTVSGTFTYANGQSIQLSTSFWIIPTIYIIAAIVAIIIIIVLIFAIRAFLKNYKRRILRNHR